MATIFEHYDVDTDTRIYLDSMTRTGYFPMHDGTREVRYDDLSTAVNNTAYALRKFRSADEVADDLESIVNYFNDENGNMCGMCKLGYPCSVGHFYLTSLNKLYGKEN